MLGGQTGHNSTSGALREIFAAGRPLVEQWLDVAEQIAALRDVAAAKGLDWSQLKALMKAQIQDERDESGEGKRVKRIVEKAEFASAYADMLGLANMNENNFSAEDQESDPAPVPARNLSAAHGADESAAPILPDPHPPVADGGQPNPSLDDAGAKSDGPVAIVGQGGAQPDIRNGQSGHQEASAPQIRNEPGSESGASATLPKPVNPNCLKAKRGEPCGLAYSMASCAACVDAAFKARADA